jgi:4-hydroxy-tetrahydrodipicolinate synthase
MTGPIPEGIVPAVVTPFRDDESIDFDAWQAILETQIASGVHGLFVVGGQGEFFALNEEERSVAIRFCVQSAAGRVPVYANVGAVTTRQSVQFALQAQADGADYLVAITPYYLKPSAEELAEHYIEIARYVNKPVLAYNIPERTGVELTPEIAVRIQQAAPNFIGLKDSSGNVGQIPVWRELGLVVFIGRDHLILEGLKAGCQGAVTACANVAPRAFVALYEAYRAGDLAEAERLQKLVEPLRRAFGLGTFPAVVKEAMAMAGVPAGKCRRPVGPLSDQARLQLEPVVNSLREAGYLAAPARQRGKTTG